MNLLERIWDDVLDAIWDRIFWTFVLLVMIVLGLAVMAFDFFFESFFPEDYNRWFSADANSAIKAYQAFAAEYRVICWIAQWPLMLVGM